MKKLLTITLMLAGMLFMLSGCASRYSINKEAPENYMQQPFNSIHVSWLDLGINDWEKLGYDSKAAWGKDIAANYHEGLKPYMTELFTDKKMSFSKSMTDSSTYGSDLIISFTNTRVDQNWNAMTGGFDYIHTTIHFTDSKTGKEIYAADISTSSIGVGPQGWAFEGRLGFCTYNIALMIYDRLQQ
ncbi:MAG: hypothetical protein EHJ94_04140 [Deltaproteobacteria bacterium]|nr:MAG: hypothetical protein EHJ94_04140 [Deltaproteobacteria bacterium]